MNIQKVSADRLNPAAYNPRRDLKPGDKDYEKLKRSIEEFGFVEPVVWNRRTGFVVGGHQRLKVLLDMGETEIDCVVVDLEPEKEKALNLALNRIQGDWDEAKLAEVIAELDASAFDVSFTGFDAEEIDALMNKFYSAEAVQDDVALLLPVPCGDGGGRLRCCRSVGNAAGEVSLGQNERLIFQKKKARKRAFFAGEPCLLRCSRVISDHIKQGRFHHETDNRNEAGGL